MFDTLQALLWGVTYVLILLASVKGRTQGKPSIPYIALVLNFAWEVCALIHSRGMWIHVLWLSLDIGILVFGVLYLRDVKKRVIMLIKTVCTLILFSFIFSKESGMLLSSFVIDFTMAMVFVDQTMKLSPVLQLPIASTKLLGDVLSFCLYYATSFISKIKMSTARVAFLPVYRRKKV